LYATYINLSGGSLYYNLGQLEQAGYIAKAWVEQKGRYPARQVYQITPAGKVHLLEEIRRLLLDTEGREKLFDPLRAALAFGHFISTEELREALTSQLTWAQKRAEWVEKQQAYWSEQNIPLAQAKIIEHGLTHLRAEIDWLEKFILDLDASVEMTQLKRAVRSNVS